MEEEYTVNLDATKIRFEIELKSHESILARATMIYNEGDMIIKGFLVVKLSDNAISDDASKIDDEEKEGYRPYRAYPPAIPTNSRNWKKVSSKRKNEYLRLVEFEPDLWDSIEELLLSTYEDEVDKFRNNTKDIDID